MLHEMITMMRVVESILFGISWFYVGLQVFN